jgi:hypothetical protein
VRNSTMLKINNSFNGPQLKLNKIQRNSQFATETTDQLELTAKLKDALVPTDHLMDQLELHALETNQNPSHTITLTQLPEDHMPLQETLPTPTHLHQYQLKPSSNWKLKVIQHQHQKRSPFLTQRSARPTLLSMDKSE